MTLFHIAANVNIWLYFYICSWIHLSHFMFFLMLLSYVRLFCNLVGCSPPGSSVHGISQARILKWVAVYFSRGSSRPRDQIWGLLYWQMDFLPLNHWGSPHFLYFIYFLCIFTFYISYNLWKLHSTLIKKMAVKQKVLVLLWK